MKEDKPELKKTVIITFKIEGDVKELLDKYTMKQRLSRSDVIRYAVEQLLKERPEYHNIEVPFKPERLSPVTFKTDIRMKEDIDNYARSQYVSRSKAIRYAVLRLLKEEGVLE